MLIRVTRAEITTILVRYFNSTSCRIDCRNRGDGLSAPFFFLSFSRDNATTRWIRKDVNTDREGGDGKLYALNTSKKIKIESGREKLISAFNFEIEYTTYLRLRILSANNCYKT